MTKSYLVRWLNSFSDNRKSKIENRKWLGLAVIRGITLARLWEREG